MAAREEMLIVYGHDPESWPRLRKAPDWYE
jgi:hypothetical protein